VWAGALTVGYDENGRRKRRTVYGPTKACVLDQLARLRADVIVGTTVDAQHITLAAFLVRWLEDAARPAIRVATYHRYRELIRIHVVPRLGGIRISRLSPAHIQNLLTSMERSGASPRVRQLVYGILHRAFAQAVRWGIVARNMCDAVAKPRAQRSTMQVLTAEEVLRLFEAAEGDRLRALYVLAVTTGLRQGELLGLQWGDVDLSSAVVRVRQALHELAGRLWLDEPKNAKARRTVDLPALTVTALQAHREQMLAEGHVNGLVFCDTNGGPVRKSNLIRRSFKPLLAKAGLPMIRFHDLRHTAATLLLAEGVHPKIVQERLGHAQIAMTLDVYSHVLPSMGRDAATRLDRALSPAHAANR
jgi:integrase